MELTAFFSLTWNVPHFNHNNDELMDENSYFSTSWNANKCGEKKSWNGWINLDQCSSSSGISIQHSIFLHRNAILFTLISFDFLTSIKIKSNKYEIETKKIYNILKEVQIFLTDAYFSDFCHFTRFQLMKINWNTFSKLCGGCQFCLYSQALISFSRAT